MRRRNILLGGLATFTAPAVLRHNAAAQMTASAADPNRLDRDLTPLGAERAASKSGLVPAWTGGLSTPPAGWKPGMNPPNMFPNQEPLFTVTVDNMAQYKDMLCQGQIELLTRYGGQGYKIIVYPSQRTACAPQYVYDNTKLNVTRAQAIPKGLKVGFTGAVGGPPFPILSVDPAIAGVQAMWNHQTRWRGTYVKMVTSIIVVGRGQRSLTDAEIQYTEFPYYFPNITPDAYNSTYNSTFYRSYFSVVAPANAAGGEDNITFTTMPLAKPNVDYEYLVGEGRIRQVPNIEYDVPESQTDDVSNVDEAYVFTGPMDRYNWKLLGKKEMIVPYNIYDLYHAQPADALGEHFVKPELLRHEVHRCWVVEARLAPGARMSEPLRRFYLDEDTWAAVGSDAYDDQGNYWKYNFMNCMSIPELPGTATLGNILYDLQQNKYLSVGIWFDAPAPLGSTLSLARIPASVFDPESMANSGGL